MLFQATVPNTYAAGQASRATWIRRGGSASFDVGPAPAPGTWTFCECGQRRLKTKAACTSCMALDAAQDTAVIDAEVFKAVVPSEEVTLTALVERFNYKHPRHVLKQALRRQIVAGMLKRRPINRRDGFLYSRVA